MLVPVVEVPGAVLVGVAAGAVLVGVAPAPPAALGALVVEPTPPRAPGSVAFEVPFAEPAVPGSVAPGAVDAPLPRSPFAEFAAPLFAELAPATVVPGALAPGTPVAEPAPAPAPAAPSAPAGVVAVRDTVTVPAGERGGGVGGVPIDPASDTSAAVSAPRESTITALSAITGPRQPGVAARRVRAAAPHRRHHSCSAPSGAPHSGQPSAIGPGLASVAGVGGVAVLI